MLEAKSMYFGGEIVEAIDVNLDWDSYKELGLLCPFCNEPVFLCGETVRQRKSDGKLSYVQPHFKHFPGGDPTDLDCEKRYFTPEGKRYIDAMRAERRGQRLELFNRYFWDMFCDGRDCGLASPSHERSAIPTLKRLGINMEVADAECTSLHSDWIGAVDRGEIQRWVSEFIPQMLDSRSEWRKTGIASRGGLNPDMQAANAVMQERLLNTIIRSVDQKVHELIVLESVNFISTRQGFPSFRRLFYLQVFELAILKNFNVQEVILENVEAIKYLIMMLCMTNWQQQLEEKAKLKEQTRGKGFVKK